MKKICIVCFVLLLQNICSGQSTCIVELECTPDGKIQMKNSNQNCTNGNKVLFKIDTNFKCCSTTLVRIKVTRNSRIQDISLVDNQNNFFFMSNEKAALEYSCNGENKGKDTILVGSPTPNNAPPRNNQPDSITYGNTLQDAIQLAEWWQQYKASAFRNTESQRKILTLLKNNNFKNKDWKKITYLGKYNEIQLPIDNQSTQQVGNLPVQESQTPAPSNLSGLFSPTLIIDALGKFAAKRFKEELTIAYLQKFRDTLSSPRYEELGILLPRTYYTLLYADVFNYPSFFQSLHENAQTDLYNLPTNVATLVRRKEEKIDKQAFPVILSILDIPRVLELRLPASQAIEYLAYRDYIYTERDSQTVYGNAARVLGVFSKNLHSWSGSTATGWAEASSLSKIVNNEDVFNFWMALLLKKDSTDLKTIHIKIGENSTNFYDLLNDKLPDSRNYLKEIIARFAEIQTTADRLMTLGSADSLALKDHFFKYTEATLSVIEAQIKLVQQLAKNDTEILKHCGQILPIIKSCKDLSAFARNKRFGDALSVLLELFKIILPKADTIRVVGETKITDDTEHIFNLAKERFRLAKEIHRRAGKTLGENSIDEIKITLDTAKAQLKRALMAFRSEKKGKLDNLQLVALADSIQKPGFIQRRLALEQSQVVLKLLDKYGNLLVSIANAQNSDQLLAILEKTAAPVQSYRIKRAANSFSASINMYPGLAYGREYRADSTGNVTNKSGQVAAFTTPVGVSLNFGLGKSGSLSAFFSLIDIGAVTAFRLKDTVSVLPDLKWKNIYAPGAYVMWGIPKSPLTFGVGAQYGPALRTVDVVNGVEIKASHLRFGASLTVDIPLFFTNSRSMGRKGIKIR